MATIQEIFDEVHADVFDTFGEAVSATFRPAIGPDVDGCTVIVKSEMEVESAEFGSALHAQQYRLRYNLNDTGKIAVKGDRFDIGSAVYTVEGSTGAKNGRVCDAMVRIWSG